MFATAPAWKYYYVTIINAYVPVPKLPQCPLISYADLLEWEFIGIGIAVPVHKVSCPPV